MHNGTVKNSEIITEGKNKLTSLNDCRNEPIVSTGANLFNNSIIGTETIAATCSPYTSPRRVWTKNAVYE